MLGGAARREIRQRLMRRAGRNVTTFAPFLTGAVAGAELNRRETRRLGEEMLADLVAADPRPGPPYSAARNSRTSWFVRSGSSNWGT